MLILPPARPPVPVETTRAPSPQPHESDKVLELILADDDTEEIDAYAARIKSFRGEEGEHINIKVPKSYEDAITSQDKDHYWEAMNDEMASIKENQVAEAIPLTDVPKGRKIVGTVWVYDVKRNEKGLVEKWKARICAQGLLRPTSLLPIL